MKFQSTIVDVQRDQSGITVIFAGGRSRHFTSLVALKEWIAERLTQEVGDALAMDDGLAADPTFTDHTKLRTTVDIDTRVRPTK